MTIRILTGDCRELMPAEGPFDMILADPPYGDTSLEWDVRVSGWERVALERMKPTGSMWVFGSLRFFMDTASAFRDAGWRYAQDVVWEKNTGTGFSADRFKRVHEAAVQFYRSDAPWSGVYNDVQKVLYLGPRKGKVLTKRGDGTHLGKAGPNVWEDDGQRIMRSVITIPNMRGKAIHPTEKPTALLEILIRTSCPLGGLVGDFFAGSGAAGEACQITGRRYVGCEIAPDMAEKARGRLGSTLFGGAQPPTALQQDRTPSRQDAGRTEALL